jgi:hypothetical protein
MLESDFTKIRFFFEVAIHSYITIYIYICMYRNQKKSRILFINMRKLYEKKHIFGCLPFLPVQRD